MAAIPVLKRFQQRIVKTGPGGGLEPATGATVKFYRVGATATTATGVPIPPTEVEIPVFSLGTIAEGDELQNGANEGELMEVIEVLPAELKVKVVSKGGSFSVEQYARLIRKTDPPLTVYRDPMGEVSLGNELTLVEADDGWAQAYVAEYRNDRTVTGGGVSPAAYPDAEGSWILE